MVSVILGTIFGLLLTACVLLLINRSNQKTKITYLEGMLRCEKGINTLRENCIDDLRIEIRKLERKIKSLQSKKFCVGATFFYPQGHNFKDELVGKRAKIVEITNEQIKSRLIDSEGNFIDETIWNGVPESALTYIYEDNCGLYFNFK